jgi:hypothetical protein
MFGVTETTVGTRAFLVDNYAAGQEFHPFYGTGKPIFVFREAFCWNPY